MNAPSSRKQNAALRAEIEAWLSAHEADPTIYVNVRAAGFTRMRDAQAWARHYGLAAVPMGGKLLARRHEFDAAAAAHRARSPEGEEQAKADPRAPGEERAPSTMDMDLVLSLLSVG